MFGALSTGAPLSIWAAASSFFFFLSFRKAIFHSGVLTVRTIIEHVLDNYILQGYERMAGEIAHFRPRILAETSWELIRIG